MNESFSHSSSSSSDNSSQYMLYKSLRIIIYINLLIIITAINISNGLFPSASIPMKNDLQITETYFGMLALASNLGKVIGSLVFIALLNSANRKWLLIITIVIKGILLLCFVFSTNNILLLLSYRMFIGLCNMIVNTFAPIWIEQFGAQTSKAILIGLIQIGNPFGKIFAFCLNFYFTWRVVLLIEGTILAASGIFISFIPHIYFSSKVVILINSETGEELIDKKNEKIVCLFKFKTPQSNTKEKNSTITDNESLCSKLQTILRTKLFLIPLLIRTCLIAIQSTIQFWTPEYLTTVLEVEEHSLRKLLYNIFIIITLPLGSFVSGIFISFNVRGYERSNYSSIFILIFYGIAFCISIYIPTYQTATEYVVGIVIFSFLTSACLPMLQGICITSIHPKLKGVGFSLSHFFTFLIGSGLTPSIYGYFNERSHEKHYTPMKYLFLIFMSVGGVLVVPLVYLLYIQQKSKSEETGKKSYIKLMTPQDNYSFNNSVANSSAEVIVQELAQAYGEQSGVEYDDK